MDVAAWLNAVVFLTTGPSVCSGVVISPGGTIATAYHCVANGMHPLVELRDGRTFVAEIVARDPGHDLALIQIQPDSQLATLSIRTTDPVLGERVYGLGHPFASAATGRYDGLLRWSVSEGIISAIGDWYIQTDAALNPGNSGGPVVDAQGRIIGITSRKLNADNIAFLSKANHLLRLVATPDPGGIVGGNYGLNPAIFQTNTTLFWGGNLWLCNRERLVLRGWVGSSTSGVPYVAGTAEVRQRLGRGVLSTSVDVGGGALAVGGRPHPVVSGRIGLGEVGFGAMVTVDEGDWNLTLDIGVPGVLGVF